MMNDEKIVVGYIADTVREIMSLYPDQIQSPPKLGSRFRIDFTQGILEQDVELIIILDIDRIVTGDNSINTSEATEKDVVINDDESVD